MYIKFLS